MTRVVARVGLLALVLVPASIASAEWPPARGIGRGDLLGDDRPHLVMGELGIGAWGTDEATPFGRAETDATVIALLMSGYFEFDSFGFAAIWGFSYGDVSYERPGADGSESTVAVGNPTLIGYYILPLEAVTLRVGGGLALPLASVDEDDSADALADVAALGGAFGIHGGYDGWLWEPDRLSILLPTARLDFGAGPLLLGAEAGIGIMVYTGDADDVDTNVRFQAAFEAMGFATEGFFLGGRFQLAAELSGAFFYQDDDRAQLSLEPFLGYDGGSFFFRGGLVMNLDDPLGFAFDEGKIWGLRMAGGGWF